MWLEDIIVEKNYKEKLKWMLLYWDNTYEIINDW